MQISFRAESAVLRMSGLAPRGTQRPERETAKSRARVAVHPARLNKPLALALFALLHALLVQVDLDLQHEGLGARGVLRVLQAALDAVECYVVQSLRGFQGALDRLDPLRSGAAKFELDLQ